MKPGQTQDEAYRRAEAKLRELNLPVELMSELIREQTSADFSKSAPIFVRGSTADVVYWVISGLVKVYCPLPDRNSVLVRIAGPGDFIGFADIREPSSRRRFQALEARAMTNTSVAIFTRDRIRTLLRQLSPESLISLIEHINTAWCVVSFSSLAFGTLSVRKRLESILQELAGRFGTRDERGILLTIELSHDDLAEMIFSSRPMVTRLIAEFVSEGLISRQGRRYILLKNLRQNGSHPAPQG